jgi:hypothetical protein
MLSRGHHTAIFIISMFMLLLLKDLLVKFIVTYTLKDKLTTWLCVNTKNWYRKETDMWAEFSRRGPFDRSFFSKAFGRGVCGREYVVVRQKDFSTGGSEKHSGMHDDMD